MFGSLGVVVVGVVGLVASWLALSKRVRRERKRKTMSWANILSFLYRWYRGGRWTVGEGSMVVAGVVGLAAT